MADEHPAPAISRKILPPHWFLVSVLLELALDRWVPIVEWIPRPINYYLGGVLFLTGVALLAWAATLFLRARTGIVPFSPSTTLVAKGPYHVTRNPMYLGMATTLAGAAVLLGSVTPFFVPPTFVILITNFFILPEEDHMEKAFGDAYLEFKRQVPRWL